MNIAICNDVEIIGKALENILTELDPTLQIYRFTSPKQLIMTISETLPIDALFMDISLENITHENAPNASTHSKEATEKNGIDYAKEFSKEHPNTLLFIMSGYLEQYVSQIFLKYNDLKISGILPKPFQYNNVKGFLEKIRKKKSGEMLGNEPHLMIRAVDRSTFWIKVADICYASIQNRTITITMTDKKVYICNGTLNALESKLPDYFLRCSQDYIINMSRVTLVRGGSAYFQEVTIPLTRYHGSSVSEKRAMILKSIGRCHLDS